MAIEVTQAISPETVELLGISYLVNQQKDDYDLEIQRLISLASQQAIADYQKGLKTEHGYIDLGEGAQICIGVTTSDEQYFKNLAHALRRDDQQLQRSFVKSNQLSNTDAPRPRLTAYTTTLGHTAIAHEDPLGVIALDAISAEGIRKNTQALLEVRTYLRDDRLLQAARIIDRLKPKRISTLPSQEGEEVPKALSFQLSNS